MGLLRSLAMLVLQLWLLRPLELGAQNVSNGNVDSARALDMMLQDYAYGAFVRPRTGIPYDGDVPSNMTGITVSAMRLRSGSLRRKGVKMYKEFEIPTGVIVHPYVKRLVLVYQNLGNWSIVYYPLPGYTYLSPVLGLLAYNASNLSATNLPELDIRASGEPFLVHFSSIRPAPAGSVPKCVWFDLGSLVNFSDVESGNTCSSKQQGHFSIVIESIAPSPSPTFPPPPPGPSPGPSGQAKKSSRSWVVVASVLGGLALLILLAMLVFWVQRYKKRKRIQRMERAAEAGEALRMRPIGDTKAPAATVTRTQPALEHEYVP
ncbi:uncharacterized protein LOC115750536 [Rhodamnia argentea]|uniref:Uncharacterized protein LOC115750536 n=1 Tax=Rhodamnia argentea TaxID=178133 RepID=A0A8B8Q9M3_9MYRT|nr:uncharacterized protein LOC115750536 [Rhodamnia argentea]